ncbi:MAG: SLC13 family permease [Pseudomonadota bacterium]|nr:SLC13 family permease [Pseudomonadota bacterium]
MPLAPTPPAARPPAPNPPAPVSPAPLSSAASRPSALRWGLTLVAAAVGAGASLAAFADPTAARAGIVASLCLALWLGEVVPGFVPTLLLLVAVPLALPAFEPRVVLGWMADPVLALFFGGFVLGEAARVHGIDQALAGAAVRYTRGRPRRLIAGLATTTAFLSMWMSNIAAAALMFACVRPLCPEDGRLRRAVLVAVALGANLGGMATPIGSGPNAIAIASMDVPIPFVSWMAFAVPLVAASLAFAVVLLLVVHRVGSEVVTEALPPPLPPADGAPTQRPVLVGVVAAAAILAWLAEPLHGVDAPLVSLALAAVLFGSALVPAERLRQVDWSTLLLIAGGIGLGRLVEATNLLTPLAATLASPDQPSGFRLGALLFASAVLSSIMSNTGTAALLVPLAIAVVPDIPTAPVLVALAASFGMPFVVSTPPNAMAVGAGARAQDLALPGFVLLIGGCALLAITGPWVLGAFGVG